MKKETLVEVIIAKITQGDLETEFLEGKSRVTYYPRKGTFIGWEVVDEDHLQQMKSQIDLSTVGAEYYAVFRSEEGELTGEFLFEKEEVPVPSNDSGWEESYSKKFSEGGWESLYSEYIDQE